MKGNCPYCGSEESLVLVKGIEDFDIRGEIIPVEVEYYQCKECGEELEHSRKDYDPLAIAYEEYRRRKGMVQPSEIKEFRKKHGLTQKEFSDLLGIGVATLSRYENGALQDEAHDRILQLSMAPENLLQLIDKNPQAINRVTRQQIVDQIEAEKSGECNWSDMLAERYGNDEPSYFNGFQQFHIDKFFAAVKFICYPDSIYKTKLTKMLFYTDFKHFKEYSVSITGERYAHLPFGPVPDNFEILFAALLKDDPSFTKEEVWRGDYPGEVFKCINYPNLSVFTTPELKTLATVKEKFQSLSAKDIMELSHKERAYQETRSGELISYEFAEYLQI